MSTSKRVLDTVLGAVLLVLVLPLVLAGAVAIVLDSPGPVFFRQVRVGRDGRPFTLLKLRTMRTGAQHEVRLLREREQVGGLMFKLVDDPRVTSVGRVLRRYSIDELPQLVNVVLGQMSLVGPRPALPEEVAQYPPRARTRLTVRPGLTGLWQVSGRADLTFEESVDLDLHYVEHADLMMDVLILARTPPAVLTGRGAY